MRKVRKQVRNIGLRFAYGNYSQIATSCANQTMRLVEFGQTLVWCTLAPTYKDFVQHKTELTVANDMLKQVGHHFQRMIHTDDHTKERYYIENAV